MLKNTLGIKEVNKIKGNKKGLLLEEGGKRNKSKIANIEESPELSIIIPAYNEEKTISSIITAIKSVVISQGISHEIIVINDGSTDLTEKKARETEVGVINLINNVGKGNALRIGFIRSLGNNVMTVDADGSHHEDDIKRLIMTFFQNNQNKCQMLIGSRFIKKSKYQFTSSMNIVGNKIFKYLLLLISGVYITDSQSGLRIFDKRLLSFINSSSNGYEIESELTAEALGMGFHINEIAINCKPRVHGISHLNSFRDGFKIIKTIIYSYFLGRKKLILIQNNRNSL